MRINARLDDSYEEKFHLIQQVEQKNRSEILKEALDHYFSMKFKQQEQTVWEQNQKLLKRLGGIISSTEDGSVNYKKYVAGYLNEKFSNH